MYNYIASFEIKMTMLTNYQFNEFSDNIMKGKCISKSGYRQFCKIFWKGA